MRITSNSATTVSIVNITAEAYAVNELHIGNAEGYADSIVTIHLSMNNMDAINGFQVEFNLPSQLEYIEGSFALSDRKADHKVVANLSGSTLKAVCYSPTNAAFKGNDGDIATFRVRLAGQYGTTIEATTAILSAEVDGKVQNVLSGRSAGNISIMAPSIYTDYSWQTFDMGSTSITTKAAKALTIQNNGSAPLTISRIQFSEEDFAVDAPLPIKLDPWQSKAINVIYNGTATGDYAAIMQLYSNDPGQRLYQIHISGHRYSPNFLSSSAPAVAPGDTTAVVFGLDNNDAISGIQFDLNYDPSLFTIVDKTENGERAKNMTVTHRTLASGTERYFCYFLDDTSIAKGSGEIFKIYLRPDTAVSNGTYPVMISNIKLGTNGLKDMNAGSDYSTDIHVERPVVIRAVNVTREYGDDNPEFTFISEGNTVNGTPEITCEATKNSPVGTYPIVIKKGSVTNYNGTYINGTLTITKAPLTASAGTYTRKQGKANPAFKVSYSGFKNGENESVLQTKATASTEAVESSPVGEYPVVVSGASAENYDINYVNGKLIVTEADLTTIVAKSYTRIYGESNPAFDYTVDGEALVGEPQISCEATATSPVGTYPIVVRQGTVGNYNTKYVNGTLTITKAPLTITVQNEEIFVGQKLPDFKVTYSGFKNDETDEVLTSHAKATAQVNNTLTAGVYAVTVAGAEAQNYEMKYINGQLTIKDITDQKRELRADYDKLVVKVDSANNVISRNESLTTALIAVYSSNIEHLDSLDTKYERCVNMLSIIKTDDRTKSELADSISEIKAAMTGIKADNETVKQSIDANQPDKSSLAVLNDTVTVIGGSLNALSLYTEIEPMRQRIDDAATAADALLANGNVSLENQRNNEMLIKQYQDSIQELIDRLNRVESTLESIITAIGDPVILDRSHGRIYDLKGMLMRDGKLQRGVYIVNGRKIVVK